MVIYYIGLKIRKRNIMKKKIKIKKITPIVYSGSLIQQDFGENVSGHGFLLWDVPTLGFTEVDLNNDYGFYKFTVNSVDDVENDKEVFNNA